MSRGNEDQRQHPRHPIVLRVAYSDQQQGLDATENLSRGGLFVQTERGFRVGEEVTVSLSFPGLLNPVQVTGTIAWVRPASPPSFPAGVGIQVEREQDRQRLGEIVSLAGPEKPASEPEAPQAAGYRVLIVEDNPHIVEMYSYVLKKLASGPLEGKVPLEVVLAQDGHGALRQLKESKVDLVMTDLYMPVMDGFALVERIRQEEALQHIPIIAISAGGSEAQERALQLGVDIYLRKPVRFAEVLETVKALLHIR